MAIYFVEIESGTANPNHAQFFQNMRSGEDIFGERIVGHEPDHTGQFRVVFVQSPLPRRLVHRMAGYNKDEPNFCNDIKVVAITNRNVRSDKYKHYLQFLQQFFKAFLD